VRTQILIVFILVSLAAAAVATAVTIYRTRVSTRIEIAASMKLAELIANEAVQLIEQGEPAERILTSLPSQLRAVRHVRIGVMDVAGAALSDAGVGVSHAAGDDDGPGAPAWFARLIGPPIERHQVPVAVNGVRIGTVEIASAPRDEIAEAWDNSLALAAVAAPAVLVLTAILYFVLGRVLDPLTSLASGLLALERRDFRQRLKRPKVAEFAAITDRFNALAGALEDARHENLALNRRLITAQDDERRRTALELHDEFGASLFGLKANAASIAKAARGLPHSAAAVIASRAGDVTAIVDHLQGINRNILNRLRPMALGHVPLREMLAELVSERARQHPDIAFTHLFDGLEASYGDTVDLTVYRCAQESLTNAIRHAGARSVEVRLVEHAPPQPGDDAKRLELTVQDDGSGLAIGRLPGFGLRGMRERVEALGGSFVIDSRRNRGTCVRMTVAVSSRRNGFAESEEAGEAT
jgi:two-component system sensor histidine kinase UhpB